MNRYTWYRLYLMPGYSNPGLQLLYFYSRIDVSFRHDYFFLAFNVFQLIFLLSILKDGLLYTWFCNVFFSHIFSTVFPFITDLKNCISMKLGFGFLSVSSKVSRSLDHLHDPFHEFSPLTIFKSTVYWQFFDIAADSTPEK